MFGTCNNLSKQAERMMADIRIREGVQLVKKCDAIIKNKESEVAKYSKRMEKETKLAMARSTSGSHRGALLGVKAVNRTKLQIEKALKVKEFVEKAQSDIKATIVKGKEAAHEMALPYDMEKIQKEIKKIEKECDSTSSSTETSDAESQQAMLQELLKLDATTVQWRKLSS